MPKRGRKRPVVTLPPLYTWGTSSMATVTVYRAYIHLGTNEWGNELMRQIADEYAAQSDKRPLIVSAHEHGGWHLSYVYRRHGHCRWDRMRHSQ